MTTKGIYIFGIVPNFYNADLFRTLENTDIYAISYENISAIVSDRNSSQLDYTDRESLGYLLVHHQETIEQLMGKGFSMIIPMRLGTIVSNRNEVVKILKRGFDLVTDCLKKVESLTEIDLAVTWADFPAIIQEISGHPEIIALKSEILGKIDKVNQVDQVKVGRLVQKKLGEKNKESELKILETLSVLSVDIKVHEVMNDQMITNSAFLLRRNNAGKFEAAIDNLDRDFGGSLNFKLVGPLPCYSFYTLEVKELNFEQVVLAKKQLGLSEEAAESDIKKAYLERAKLFHPDNSKTNGDTENFKMIHHAYNTLLDYSTAAKQSSKDEPVSLAKERVIENLILVKIKE
jgi:hypothetical protein